MISGDEELEGQHSPSYVDVWSRSTDGMGWMARM